MDHPGHPVGATGRTLGNPASHGRSGHRWSVPAAAAARPAETCRSVGGLHPDVWGQGYATETTHALAGLAYAQDVDEVFAVVQPGNIRAEATARRNGMEWVGVTDKYFGMTLHVYRLRPADLDQSTQQSQLPGGPAQEPSWERDR